MSYARVGQQILFGYDPLSGKTTGRTDASWKSSYDPVSFGNEKEGITRQITGVAAGYYDTDAASIAQLKELKEWTEKQGGTWKLSIDSGGATKINYKNGVKLISKDNLSITKTDQGVKFNLKPNLKVTSITVESNGPTLSGVGIDAGKKLKM
ncbi:hypothetical protein BWD162_001590 [Bartonella sp. WD16.2]|nr:hypothetical protein BWD162_001590 [Bartonella sp. WD16.2]